MESNTIVTTVSADLYARTLKPASGNFQGIAVPASGRMGRLRPATSGTDLRHRTP